MKTTRISGLIVAAVVLQSAIGKTGHASEYFPGKVVFAFKAEYMPRRADVDPGNCRFGMPQLDSVMAQRQGTALRKLKAEYKDDYPSEAAAVLGRTFVLEYKDGTDPALVVSELSALGYFEFVEVNPKVEVVFFGTERYVPGDSWFPQQWNLDNVNDTLDIDAPEAWAIERGDPNLVIGITDSGTMVDTFQTPWELHPDLERYWNAAEDFPNTRELTFGDVDGNDDTPSADPDTTADNVIGRNWAKAPEGPTDPLDLDFWQSQPIDALIDPLSHDPWNFGYYYPHGLMVESIAAARAGDPPPSTLYPTGVPSTVGVANQCKVYHVRIHEDDPLVQSEVLALAALYADVINMSWGFLTNPGSVFELTTRVIAEDDDVVLVAAVGNISDGATQVVWPARYDWVLGVGNMARDVDLYHDSVYGPQVGFVSVVAPVDNGVPVNTHGDWFCGGSFTPCDQSPEIQLLFNGTSAASPTAVGIAALLRSRFPSLTQDEVRGRIERSAEWYWSNPVDPNYTEDRKKFGSGKVNAYRAVTEWGTIQGNVTWSSQAAAGPSDIYTKDDIFYVSGDLTIENGAILTIDKNVTIRVAPDHEKLGADLNKVEIIVKNGGTLEIRGESGEEVVFESFTDSPPATNDWIGITFENGSQGVLEHVQIGNAALAVKIDGLSQPVAATDWGTNKKLYLNSALSIANDYTVASSDSLYVLGSTDAVVTGGGNISLQVDGSLVCIGSPTKRPTFRSSTGVASSWDGIGFTTSSQGNVLDDVIVKHAFIGIQNDVPLELNRCEISYGEEGIENNATSLTVRNSKITNQESYGIQILTGTATMVKDTISDSFLGVWPFAGTTLSCDSSLFQTLEYAALNVSGNATISVEDSRIDNTLNGIRLHPDNQGTVDRCTITNSTANGIHIDGATLPIIKNCVIDNSATNGIYCQTWGDLVIQGTTVKNSPVGVYCYAFASPTLKARNMIKSCTTGLKCAVSSHPVVEETTIKENTTGVRALSGSNPDLGQTSGGPSIGRNVIESNTLWHVNNNNTTGIEIQAERNYWGSAAGPDPAKINGLVDYIPWLINKPEIEPEWEGVVVYMPPVDNEFPARYDLAYNYPNPFNPTTRIKYDVPSAGGVVQIVIYNIRGQRVAMLLDERRPAGVHTVMWDGRDDAGEPVATGVYFVQMRSGSFRETKKLVLLK